MLPNRRKRVGEGDPQGLCATVSIGRRGGEGLLEGHAGPTPPRPPKVASQREGMRRSSPSGSGCQGSRELRSAMARRCTCIEAAASHARAMAWWRARVEPARGRFRASAGKKPPKTWNGGLA
jgi:hypothetical protein